MIVDVLTSDAMKTLSCGSQWCFSIETDDGYWRDYTDDSHVNLIFDFNREPDDYLRMVVILPNGEAYNMYNQQIDSGEVKELYDERGIADYLNIYSNAGELNENYIPKTIKEAIKRYRKLNP